MNQKRSKCIRRAVGRLFDLNQAKLPIGDFKKGEQQVNPRRQMYQRIKREVNQQKLKTHEIEAMFN